MSTMPGWVWPVCRHVDGRPPKISSGWGDGRPKTSAQPAHSHRGVDIMFRRTTAATDEQFKRDHGSKWYEAPPGTLIVAPFDAKVWSTGKSSLGRNIVLDHGAPFASFHQHLDAVHVGKGERVKAGQVIGVMGHGSIGSIRHLHFALWKGGGEEAAIDPAQLMSSWVVLDKPTAGPASLLKRIGLAVGLVGLAKVLK